MGDEERTAPGRRRIGFDINESPADHLQDHQDGTGYDDDEFEEYYGTAHNRLVQGSTNITSVQTESMGAEQASQTFFPLVQPSNARGNVGVMEMLSGPDAFHIHLWDDGFSVDDGPLRSSSVAENADFIQAIKKGKFRKVPGKKITQHNGNYRVEMNTPGGSLTGDTRATAPLLQQKNTLRSTYTSTLLYLLEHKEWDAAESSISDILGGTQQWLIHPMIFLELRRRAFMNFISQRDIPGALLYFQKQIQPFSHIVAPGHVASQYASLGHINTEVERCQKSLETLVRVEHRLDNNVKLTEFILDYVQLNVPAKLGLKIKIGLWRFAKEIPKKKPDAVKKSYRCLACSDFDSHWESIGKLKNHLVNCHPWTDSPYLTALLNKILADDTAKAAKRSQPGTQRLQVLPVPITSDDPHEKFLKDLGEAKAYELMSRQYVPSEYHGLLDRNLQSIESYVNALLTAPPGHDSRARSALKPPTSSGQQHQPSNPTTLPSPAISTLLPSRSGEQPVSAAPPSLSGVNSTSLMSALATSGVNSTAQTRSDQVTASFLPVPNSVDETSGNGTEEMAEENDAWLDLTLGRQSS